MDFESIVFTNFTNQAWAVSNPKRLKAGLLPVDERSVKQRVDTTTKLREAFTSPVTLAT